MLDYRFLFIGFIICCLPFVFCSFDMLYNSEELWTVELAKFSLVHAMLDYRFSFIGFIICCLPIVFCSFDMLYNSEELWTVELAKFSLVHAMLDYRFLFIGFIICCLPFVFCSFDMLYNSLCRLNSPVDSCAKREASSQTVNVSSLETPEIALTITVSKRTSPKTSMLHRRPCVKVRKALREGQKFQKLARYQCLEKNSECEFVSMQLSRNSDV